VSNLAKPLLCAFDSHKSPGVASQKFIAKCGTASGTSARRIL
jgi:hypothetical protein